MVISIAVAVIAATVVVIAAFLIPALLEVKRTTAAARSLIVSTEAELQPALKEFRQILMQVRDMTDTASASLNEAKGFASALGETGRMLHSINSGLGSISGLFGKSSVWTTIAVAAGQFFYDRVRKRRRKNHGE